MTDTFDKRNLENDKDEGATSYLVDSNGNAYEPYSLAWRFLGMYIDCDIEEGEESSSAYENVHRFMQSGDGEGNDCSRKVLWAAYHDPRYKDGSIGQYQFYDLTKGVWDKSTCQTKRCARMDCHEPSTHFQLVGVFKETDGLTDWAEQLFKHQGYCLWNDVEASGEDDEEEDAKSGDEKDDSSIYNFMDNFRQYWPGECTKLYLSDYDGNTIYLNTKPQSGANMTYGLYLDEDCREEATMTYPQYVKHYFESYYGYSEEQGLRAAKFWSWKLNEWNEWMTTYKVCNPCRAYSRFPSSSNEDEDNRLRFLEGNNNGEDGEGAEEQWGYNCYDDAGYTNCNQCYKFETKTDLELATTEDLERASLQGTILAIKVDGVVYGEGYMSVTPTAPQKFAMVVALVGLLGGICIGLYLSRSWLRKVFSGRRKAMDYLESSFGGAIIKDSDDRTIHSENSSNPGSTTRYTEEDLTEEAQNEVDRLKQHIAQERVRHELERMRKDEYIKALEKRIESKKVLEEAAEEGNRTYSNL